MATNNDVTSEEMIETFLSVMETCVPRRFLVGEARSINMPEPPDMEQTLRKV
jgi:hypothetical protein